MQKNLLENLVEITRLKLLPGENLATCLMHVLNLGKEAIYRRLRGEVPFTFHEVALISQRLGLSLDTLLGKNNATTIPFYLARASVTGRVSKRGLPLDWNSRETRDAPRDPDSEERVALNILPVVLVMDHPHLFKFRVFKWLYQRGGENVDGITPYSQVSIPPGILQHGQERLHALSRVSNIDIILDKMLFTRVINDIRSFAMTGLLAGDEVSLIKRDLVDLIDKLERMAATGENDMGNNLDLFLSDTSFESTYLYTTSRQGVSCAIAIFSMNLLHSPDPGMFRTVKQWVDSLKQYSNLITRAGEILRRRFFQSQRGMIEAL